jgi:hypothetical protein
MKRIVYIAIIAITLAGTGIFYGFKNPNPTVNWYQVTVIESVVPGGVGRSRMISQDAKGGMDEIKLKNFFSLAGINFGNIKDNDVKITEKIRELTNEGWELYNVTSGVYSGNQGVGGGNGIFITRYLFKKTE